MIFLVPFYLFISVIRMALAEFLFLIQYAVPRIDVPRIDEENVLLSLFCLLDFALRHAELAQGLFRFVSQPFILEQTF